MLHCTLEALAKKVKQPSLTQSRCQRFPATCQLRAFRARRTPGAWPAGAPSTSVCRTVDCAGVLVAIDQRSGYAGCKANAGIETKPSHETKNVICGEGGALLVNDPGLVARAEVIREKGTDRSRFFRGEVDKYTWQDVGSSYLAGELAAAFLWAQLEEAEEITYHRLAIWERYHRLMAPLEARGLLRRPIVPEECRHNAHMYYVVLAPELDRAAVLAEFGRAGIGAIFHYVPLHSSPGGRRFGRAQGTLANTDALSARLIRLPFWVGISFEEQQHVVDRLAAVIGSPM